MYTSIVLIGIVVDFVNRLLLRRYFERAKKNLEGIEYTHKAQLFVHVYFSYYAMYIEHYLIFYVTHSF